MTQGGVLLPGDMAIRALVRAKLLGLQILTLDAQVIVGKQRAGAGSTTLAGPEARSGRSAVRPLADGPALAGRAAVAGEAALPAPPWADEPRPAQAWRIPDAGSGHRLARAVMLVEQGAQTLEQSRDPASS